MDDYLGSRADDPIIITTRDIYQLASETAGKVDTLIQVTALSGDGYKDHETRIRRLEAWRYALPTALFASLFSSVATVALFLVERATT